MSALPDAQPGALLLGRYEIISELGHGGMATVYRARAAGPMGFEKTLVVKCILPNLAQDPQFVEMFLTEAKLAAQLNHPNIVHIFDFGEAEGAYYIAMEFIDGPNLRALMRRAQSLSRPLPLPLCAKIISAACEGLAYAHEFSDPQTGEPLHLIHRDVSPDNILLARNGTVKLVDFGIAKAANQVHQTRVGTLKGKVPFMAPEQLRNEAFDHRIDVYALGVVLYELVTGRKPYEAQHEAALIHAILYEPFVPVANRRQDVPEPLQQIIARALAKNPEERYASCRELQADLDHFLLSLGQTVGAYQLGQLITQLAAAPGGSTGSAGTPVSGSRPRLGSGTGSRPRLRVSTTPTHRPPPVDPALEAPDFQVVEELDPHLSVALTEPAVPAMPAAARAPVSPPPPPGLQRHRWLFPAVGGALLLAAVVIVALGRGGTQNEPQPAPIVAQPAPPPVTRTAPPAETAPQAEPAAAAVAAATPAPDALEQPEPAPASAEPAPAPAPVPARPSKIELQVVVTPRKAQVFLDDKPLPRLPYSGKFNRDDKVHTLRVSAPGFEKLVKEVRFEKDLALDISLQRKVPEPRRPAPAKTVAAPAEAPEKQEKQEAAVDFPELAPKTPKSPKAKRALDEESPWSEGSSSPDSQRP